MHAKTRRNVGQTVGHACATGQPVDQALGPFQHPGNNPLGRGHFPQDVGVDTALAARDLVRNAGLRNAATNGVVHKLLMPFPAGAAVVDLRNRATLLVIAVRIDNGDRARTPCSSPCPGRCTRGNRNALAAFYQRQDIRAPHAKRVNRLHDYPVVFLKDPCLPRPHGGGVTPPPCEECLIRHPGAVRGRVFRPRFP